MNKPKAQVPVKIHIGPHARERARERFPGFKAARIIDEIREGMLAGRMSRKKPATVSGNSADKALYVWTPDGQRVYVMVATDEVMMVMTTLKADLEGVLCT